MKKNIIYSSCYYSYDAIGNLIRDTKEGITGIDWSVYGKIKQINKANGNIFYSYDPSGNRVAKLFNNESTWYVRDAQGNSLAVYDNEGGHTNWKEQQLYGSSRLGMWKPELNLDSISTNLPGLTGNKNYELTNHLGNVMAVITDNRTQVGSEYEADVINAQDYYAFGSQMPGRIFNLGGYRYGFNGKENDNEVKGDGNQQDYGMRIYDPRIGKFLSVDPIAKDYPMLTPYQFASNRVIDGIDLDGLEYYKLDLSITNGKTKLRGSKVRDFEIFGWKYSDALLIDVKYKGNNFRFEEYTGGPYKGGLPYNDFGDFNNFIKDPEGYRKNVVSDVEWGGAVGEAWVASEVAFPSNMRLPERKPINTNGMNNPNVRVAADLGNKVHYDKLNGGSGEALPSELSKLYPESEFSFAKRGQKGADVKWTGGKHPSEYKGSTWEKGNNYGDFKPNSTSGKAKFNSEVKSGKLPKNTQKLLYDTKTGKLK